jgi:FixJ family two-component response regulator
VPGKRQVVDLAVEGLTNPEIGDKLFISRRTAQGHLARVYRKLDISSRRELRQARPSCSSSTVVDRDQEVGVDDGDTDRRQS